MFKQNRIASTSVSMPLALILSAAVNWCSPLFAAEPIKPSTTEVESKKIPSPADPDSFSVKYRYTQMIAEERRKKRMENTTEKIVSGVAALAIGFYGYYLDGNNTARRLAYNATQTAGVLMIGSSLEAAESPNQLLEIDRRFRENNNISFKEYKSILVDVERRKHYASYKQLGYTSGILSLLYGYNSYYERNRNTSLRNVFAFLSFNFGVISAVSLSSTEKYEVGSASYSVSLLPYPTFAATF